MNIIKSINFIVLFALCITISNNINAIARYKARPLEKLINNTLNNGELGFQYKFFNKKDCKAYLGRRKIISKKYTPIQLNITNNTNKSLQFSLDNFSLPTVSYNKVAHDVRFSMAGRIFGLILPWALVALPLSVFYLIMGTLGHSHTQIGDSFYVGCILIPTLFGIFVPPAIAGIEGSQSSHAQSQLCTDYESKALHDTIIKPFDTINGIVFVRTQKLEHDFSVKLVDTRTQESYSLSTDAPSISVQSNHAFFPVFKNPFKFI